MRKFLELRRVLAYVHGHAFWLVLGLDERQSITREPFMSTGSQDDAAAEVANTIIGGVVGNSMFFDRLLRFLIDKGVLTEDEMETLLESTIESVSGVAHDMAGNNMGDLAAEISRGAEQHLRQHFGGLAIVKH